MSAGVSYNYNLERPTFGVEIEFLIPTLAQGVKDPHGNIQNLSPVLRVPRGARTRDYAYQTVRDILNEYFGTEPLTPALANTSVAPRTVLDKYRDFDVDDDESLIPPSSERLKYDWVEVEVATPVQYAAPRAFEVISFAVSAITSGGRIPLEHFRRIASLSYAVEPLLYTLHDPTREVNINSRQLCIFSKLALGLDTEARHSDSDPATTERIDEICLRNLGRERRHGERSMLVREKDADLGPSDIEEMQKAFDETRKPGHYEPFEPGDPRHTAFLPSDIDTELDRRVGQAQLPSTPTEIPPARPARQRGIPRLRPRNFDRATLDKLTDIIDPFGASLGKAEFDRRVWGGYCDGAFEATEQIYSHPSTCSIANLLTPDDRRRVAINYKSYECSHFRPLLVAPRTIEFRMGEGSLGGEWISTWAKIVTGIFRFAIYSSPDEFIDVLAKCAGASEPEGEYDVVDLLDDVGLFAEAEIVEKRLLAHKDKWDIEFVEPQ